MTRNRNTRQQKPHFKQQADLAANLIHLQIIAEIDKAWNTRFPQVPEEERFTSDKDEIIKLFIDRIKFANTLAPKITDPRTATQHDITKSYLVSQLKCNILEDIRSTPYKDEIMAELLKPL